MVGKLYLRMNKNVVTHCLRFGGLFFVLCGMHKTVSVFFTVSFLLFSRHVAPSRIIVSRHRLLSYLRRCAGSRSAIQRDASLGGSCATRVCLCAANNSCPSRHSFGGSARAGGSIRCQCALRCPGHSLIWRSALSRAFADMAPCVVPHVAVIRRGIAGRTSVY